MILTISSALTAPNQNPPPTMFVPNPMLPADVSSNCTVTAPMFASWFKSGNVTPNGEVNPADSVQFPNTPNCSFYQWSEQMFLWLTSPSSSAYGGGAHIFESPAFYGVSPPDPTANFQRTFVPHVNGQPIAMALRVAKPDANGLPVIFDRAHVLREIVPAKTSRAGRPLVLNRAGTEVEVRSVRRLPNGAPVFFDNTGRIIAGPRPIVPQRLLRVSPTAKGAAAKAPAANRTAELARTGPIQKFFAGAQAVFLNTSGGLVDIEPGQADNSVWQAQNGSMVYYAISVNDIYAWFLTGQKHNQIIDPITGLTTDHFPTKPAERDAVLGYAAGKGQGSFPDPNALAVEVKTAWVELAGLPNPGSYITTTATVPTYSFNVVSGVLTQNGTKTVALALVGIHVVGSTFGHPEMIWATFEHINNAPNAAYRYKSTSGVQTVAQNTAGSWTFCCANAGGPFNKIHMTASGQTINPVFPFPVSPSDLLRAKAWGAAFNTPPNPIVASDAESNSEIISVDRAVDLMLDPADKRRNYMMTGATWTPFGTGPTGNNSVGTSHMANTTMETNVQGPDNTNGTGQNCFPCHSFSGTSSIDVSHIYGPLKPLIP